MEAKRLTADRFVDKATGISYRYVYSDTEFFRPHYHDYFEIFLMLEGSAEHMVNGSRVFLSKGRLVLIRPEDCHDYVSPEGKSFSFLNLTFTAQTAQSLFSYLGEGFPSRQLCRTVLPPEVQLTEYELSRLCRRMDSICSLDPNDPQRTATALRMLLFDIFTRHFAESIAATEGVPGWLEEMCAAIRRDGNFTKGSEYFFSLSDKSREHICRCMKQYMGLTVSQYINDLRLRRMANMLRNSNHTITEILFESGFNNISWASEQFKKKFGMTMSQYRKAAR